MAKKNDKDANQDSQIEDGKIFAVIGYLGILCLVPLLLKKNNKFALFHGKQGLVLFIGEVGASIITIIPILGQLIWILAVMVFGMLSLVGIVQSLMGNYWRMPVIGEIAEKISL
ncbi:MAG: hypothetical protein ISS34_05550 [Candidatus Omnitrophica bacterium]|nr:hypothetical protein [Candidatus Omnitrophota bacterium]